MFKIYRELEKGELIAVGVDSSMGLSDFTTAQFVSKTKLDVPIVFHSSETMTAFTPLLHEALERVFDITGTQPLVAIERANGGAFELDRLAALNRLGKYQIFRMPPDGLKLGWDTNLATRPKMLLDLKEMVDNRVLKIFDKATIEELFAFVKVRTSASIRAQAERGSHDDLVMALAIAVQVLQDLQLQTQSHVVSYEVKESVRRIAKKMQGFY